jgi:small subunit ribosomal protein S20
MPRDRRATSAAAGGSIVAKRTKSGLKHLRTSARRREANTGVRSRIKTLFRTGQTKLEQVPEAQAAIDKAASHGIMHPNTAARRKSRLMRRLKAAQG